MALLQLMTEAHICWFEEFVEEPAVDTVMATVTAYCETGEVLDVREIWVVSLDEATEWANEVFAGNVYVIEM